jgi:hypothetical protein
MRDLYKFCGVVCARFEISSTWPNGADLKLAP